jgi:hypothetical protein
VQSDSQQAAKRIKMKPLNGTDTVLPGAIVRSRSNLGIDEGDYIEKLSNIGRGSERSLKNFNNELIKQSSKAADPTATFTNH